MSYSVKELIYTLQGEGAQAGMAAVFCRFAGCNLWSGLAADRESAVCRFCDTDFVGTDGPGGGEFSTAETLANAIAGLWPQAPPKATMDDDNSTGGTPLVVFTGGEPLLQLDQPLVDAVHRCGFAIAVETNGTLPAPRDLDWICVSPKAGATLRLLAGHELKLVYPQEGLSPEQFENLDFRHYFLQPMDGPRLDQNMRLAVAFCLQHPRWRISLQTHKILGIP